MSIETATLRDLANRHGTPLLVLDCDEVRARYRALTAALPTVAMHYAIKALPNDAVVRTLWDEGAGFDVASAGEIGALRRAGIDPRRCIHTHPIKKPADIKAALRFGCTTFVVDNPAEIEKFVPFRYRVGLLLRVSFRSPDAVVDLSRKFGCSVDEAPRLLARARQLGVSVKGLSFHVGSQSGDAATHVAAVRACATLMAEQRALGAPLSLLDIGGGFPVDYATGSALDIDAWCRPVRDALATLPDNVSVIAEPGRYLVASAVTGVFSVVGKALRDDGPWYYLDDGVYGSFSGQLFDHAHYPLRALDNDGPTSTATVAGPTCDSIDVIAENLPLPTLAVGDLVTGAMMGAYTAASATDFNSLTRATVVAVNAPAHVRSGDVTQIA
ncbi:MAG: type III PLP-dependent enzyme [Pseudomonadota bacterium]